MVISLVGGDWGVSGMSGKSIFSSSSSCPSRWGGAPRAAEGGLRRALGRGASPGRTRLEEILGGQSGLGAVAGVLGVDAIKVLTITGSDEPKLPMVVMAGGGGVSPLLEKSSRPAIASISTTSPSSSCSTLGLTFRKKGKTEWGRRTPLDSADELESPLLPPNPSSQCGGAEGSA